MRKETIIKETVLKETVTKIDCNSKEDNKNVKGDLPTSGVPILLGGGAFFVFLYSLVAVGVSKKNDFEIVLFIITFVIWELANVMFDAYLSDNKNKKNASKRFVKKVENEVFYVNFQ